MAWVKTLPLKIGGSVELYYCMECESLSSPFSPPSTNTATQLEWHKSVLERNLDWSNVLIDNLINKGCGGPVVDIGSGIGSFLLAARERGWEGVGFDLDIEVCQYGREQFNLDLRAEIWREETSPKFSILTCISVLEHIHQPRPLILEMISAARMKRAKIYLSVPFFNRIWWKMLHTDTTAPGHPFEYPHAHVTHFSYKGLELLCKQQGVESMELLRNESGGLVT